eukprot:1036725-Ditylum_brightwellii.AAC.1
MTAERVEMKKERKERETRLEKGGGGDFDFGGGGNFDFGGGGNFDFDGEEAFLPLLCLDISWQRRGVGDFDFGGGDFNFGRCGDFDFGSGRDFNFDGEED